MKFKLVFGIFNLIIIISFLFLSFLPAIILDWEYAMEFWAKSWQGPLLFFTILIALDGYFMSNWKFFSLLEAKNWPGIQVYLNHRIFEKKRINYQQVRILLNTYLVQGSVDEMLRLGELIKNERPRIFKRIMVSLSIGYLLNKDYDGLINLYQDEVREKILTRDGWADWLLAFGLLRKKELRLASTRLNLLALTCRNEMVRLLALYVLIDILELDIEDEGCQQFLKQFKNKYSPLSWEKTIAKKKDQVHIVLLRDFIQQAGKWCMLEYGVSLPIASPSPEHTDDSENTFGGINDE